MFNEFLDPTPRDWVTIIGVLIIALMSGFISIAQRIARGHKVSFLWIVSEIIAAVLCGWIAHDAFTHYKAYIPKWLSPVMVISLSAFMGGRIFQAAEAILWARFGRVLDDVQADKED